MDLSQMLPAPYPLQELDLANRVAVLAMQEGWCEDYVRETYRRWFIDGHEAGSDVNLNQTLSEIGQDKLRVLGLANSSDLEAAYLNQTESAKQAGIFGSPSFIVDGELSGAMIALKMLLIGPVKIARDKNLPSCSIAV